MNRSQQLLAIHIAAAHCLTQVLGESDAQAYLLRTQKAQNLPQLSALFASLQEEIKAGNGRPLASLFDK